LYKSKPPLVNIPFVAIEDFNGHIGLGVKTAAEVATAIRGTIWVAKTSIGWKVWKAPRRAGWVGLNIAVEKQIWLRVVQEKRLSAQEMITRKLLTFLGVNQGKGEQRHGSIDKPLRGPISERTYDFVSEFMAWCAASVFDCASANWFLGRDLQIQTYDALALQKRAFVVRTVFRDDKQFYSQDTFRTLQKRLERNTIVLLLFLVRHGAWKPTRLNIIAACVTVAEVTEEISFIISDKEDVAVELLSVAIQYAYGDQGLLYKLCLKG
jgi:hypothetical protein